ncbi:NAD(P)/FAD-dependent oxidoreductase [Streptomyces sp. CC219B]|uniref:FAD-dependent oxidoreductase n=1 Tax=Streptomyces sp. CC219B TaxID=3044574 RepID=UPI0024A8F3E1|nr:NAD(P)/FAD-dependent oxidoreductase [Streptomyces sp. CC219B]
MTNENSTPNRRVAVVGAGITGPLLSLCLARLGFEVDLYEAYLRRAQDVGSFLNLAPNGRAVLERLGLADRILERGTVAHSITFANHKGRQLARNPERTTNIMRGELSAALREAATDGGVKLHTAKRLVTLDKSGEHGWRLGFEDGTRAEADIVLGCDGVNSTTRHLLLPHAPRPTYTQVVGSGGRSETGAAELPVDGRFHMVFGLRGFFGYQVVSPGVVWWFENHQETHERSFAELAETDDARWLAALARRHRPDPAVVRRILNASTGPVGRWPVHEVPPLDTWHRGSAAVLGDAAHAVAPHLGAGAALGMEDAYELALALHRHPAAPQAFTAFEESRRARVAAMAKQARQTGAVMTPDRWITRVIRDLMLPTAIKHGVRKGTEAYSYRPSPWPVRAD